MSRYHDPLPVFSFSKVVGLSSNGRDWPQVSRYWIWIFGVTVPCLTIINPFIPTLHVQPQDFSHCWPYLCRLMRVGTSCTRPGRSGREARLSGLYTPLVSGAGTNRGKSYPGTVKPRLPGHVRSRANFRIYEVSVYMKHDLLAHVLYVECWTCVY